MTNLDPTKPDDATEARANDGTPREERRSYLQSTRSESGLKALDVWASVYRARRAGTTTYPRKDAIQERPVPNLDSRLIDMNGAAVAGEMEKAMVPTAVALAKKLPAELVTFASVNDTLKRCWGEDAADQMRMLLRVLPRRGPYSEFATLDDWYAMIERERVKKALVTHAAWLVRGL